MKPSTRTYVLVLIIGWFLGAASGLVILHCMRPTGLLERPFQHEHDRFYHALKLSPEQRGQVDTILQDSRKQLDAVFTETEPRVDAIRTTTAAKIRALLSTEQQGTFDRLAARREAERRAHREMRHRNPPLL